GVASASITINGVKYNGNPHSTGSTTSLDFWVSIANLPAGQYNYAITAVDKAGNSSQLPGTFTLAGSQQPGSNPVIGSVVPSEAQKVITWNVQDADGVASASITINGVKYNGNPHSTGSTTSLDFWVSIANLSAGQYNYTITAVDKAGKSSQLPGSFTLTGGSSGVVARSAVFSGIGRSLNNRVDASAKLDWLYDEIDVEDETTASAVDAVMAAY
ncbi:MAG: hypothetical protein GX594_18010, partial [Pirellulaceae bacterium]|nr:hypothetical protein [Pirellulaceae bacterium]